MPRCPYTGREGCDFQETEGSCAECPEYRIPNCEMCASHRFWLEGYEGVYFCKKHNRQIMALNDVCKDLDPNCLMCQRLESITPQIPIRCGLGIDRKEEHFTDPACKDFVPRKPKTE